MQALIVDTEVVELRPDDEVYTVVSGWYWVCLLYTSDAADE